MAKNNQNKKPWLAAVLNILPGLGYLYLGKRTFFGGLVLTSNFLFLVDYVKNQTAYDVIPINGWVVVGLLVIVFAFMKDAYDMAKE